MTRPALTVDQVAALKYTAAYAVALTLLGHAFFVKWTPFFSKGRVYYQEFETPHPDGRVIPTPTFVVSFDAIIADAEGRNHTFLEILREGMKKYADENGDSKSSGDE